MKYKVTLSYHGSAALEVEAENEWQAKDLAREKMDHLCNTDFLETIDLQEDSCDIEETESGKTSQQWFKPRFTAKDVLEGAHYEEASYLKDIKDSMELDSDPVDLAYLKNTILTRSNELLTVDASVRVQGDVKVRFKGQWYRSASSMPEELIQCYHDGSDPAMIDPDYYVDNNNWFEEFIRITAEGGIVICEDSFVIDDVTGLKEGLADSLAEAVNDEEICLNTFFKEGDTVRWDDPDRSLPEQKYRARKFKVFHKKEERCIIKDGVSIIETPYSELLLMGD